jgi:hypothetical protein
MSLCVFFIAPLQSPDTIVHPLFVFSQSPILNFVLSVGANLCHLYTGTCSLTAHSILSVETSGVSLGHLYFYLHYSFALSKKSVEDVVLRLTHCLV